MAYIQWIACGRSSQYFCLDPLIVAYSCDAVEMLKYALKTTWAAVQ